MTKEQILIDALKKAVEVIKQWHGAEVFDIYYAHAPEMKLIRDALSQYNEAVVPEPKDKKVYELSLLVYRLLKILESKFCTTGENQKIQQAHSYLLKNFDLKNILRATEGKGEEKEVDKP